MNDDEIRNLAKQAYRAFLEEKHVLGLALTDQLIEADPVNPTYRCWQVYGLLDGGHPQQAAEAADDAVKACPSRFETHLVHAQALWTCDRMDEARREFDLAESISRGHPFVLSEYASFLAIDGDADAANVMAERALRVNAESADAWAALGLAQFRLRRQVEALSSLRRALQLNRDSDRARMALQLILADVAHKQGYQALDRMLDELPEARTLAANIIEQAQARQQAWEQAQVETAAPSRDVEDLSGKRTIYIVVGLLLAILAIAVAAIVLLRIGSV